MKVACIQMNIILGEPDQNYEIAQKNIIEAASHQADTIVLPEMWNTGYALDQLDELADKNGEKTIELLTSLAKTYHVNIVGGSVATKKTDNFLIPCTLSTDSEISPLNTTKPICLN